MNGDSKKKKKKKKGYLRCAKALILDEKPKKALEVYAYGLKALSSENPQRPVGNSVLRCESSCAWFLIGLQMMKQLHDKLHCRLFETRQDPFSVLPLEIVEMVLQCLDFRQIVYVLVANL